MGYDVWVDGSVRDNPGIGGVGVVVKENGNIVTTLEKIIGDKVTSNEAEYRAVLEGIKTVYVLNRTNKDCTIYTDSKLIYSQLVSGWRINFKHLRHLNKVIKDLMELCDFSIKFVEIRREENVEANDLAQACTKKYKKERMSEIQRS